MTAMNIPTPGDDTLEGTLGTDIIDALAGDDDVDVFGGDDTVFGRQGFDGIEGGDGNDVLFGGDDQDILTGDADNDQLFGNAGNDFLFGGSGVDTLDGGNGNDDVRAGLGNDFVFGGFGNDTLRGDNGNDEVFGGFGNDRVFGNLGDDTVNGGLGSDTAFGGDGTDVVEGGGGNDTLFGGEGGDSLFGGQGNDRLEGEDGADTLRGDAGDDRVFGGDGDDRIFGNIGDDRLFGNFGDDTIFGGQGNDTAFGGAGNDRFFVDADTGTDSIDGQGGFDRLHFETEDADLAQTLANEAAEYLAGDTSIPFEFTGGHNVVNIESISVLLNGELVEAQEEILIDFEEFDPIGIFPGPFPTIFQEMIEVPFPPFFDEAVESQGFVINVDIVGTFDETPDLVEIRPFEDSVSAIPLFDNVAGSNSFPFPLIEDIVFGPPNFENPSLIEVGLELPPVEIPFDPFILFELAFLAGDFLAGLADNNPDGSEIANNFLEEREGLPIGAVLAEFEDEILALIDSLMEDPFLQPNEIEIDPGLGELGFLLEILSGLTLEELLGFGSELLDLLPDFAAPLFITQVDGDAFALEQADLAIDAGFALVVGNRNGQVVGVEVVQTPTNLNFLTPIPDFDIGITIGAETPETTVVFDQVEFGNVDFVDIISIGNITIDNILIDDAYEVIDFEGLLEDPFFDIPIGVNGEDPSDGTTIFDEFVFTGGVPVPAFPPSLFDIGGLGLPNAVEVQEELIEPFFFNTALLSIEPLATETPVEPAVIEPSVVAIDSDSLFFIIEREDGATFDLETMLIGAESGEVEAVALLDGEIVGSEVFNVTSFENPGTLVEFGAAFEGIDEVHLLSSGDGIVIDDVQVENIGEPENLLV